MFCGLGDDCNSIELAESDGRLEALLAPTRLLSSD
jgi:hypothetical protein